MQEERKNINKIIVQNIKAERSRANMSQEEVAKKLDIGRETYVRYESEKKIIDGYTIYKLAKIFKCKISAFYLGL